MRVADVSFIANELSLVAEFALDEFIERHHAVGQTNFHGFLSRERPTAEKRLKVLFLDSVGATRLDAIDEDAVNFVHRLFEALQAALLNRLERVEEAFAAADGENASFDAEALYRVGESECLRDDADAADRRTRRDEDRRRHARQPVAARGRVVLDDAHDALLRPFRRQVDETRQRIRLSRRAARRVDVEDDDFGASVRESADDGVARRFQIEVASDFAVKVDDGDAIRRRPHSKRFGNLADFHLEFLIRFDSRLIVNFVLKIDL